ncbi:MAG: TraB/GumN family protein [Caulobacteraceae bacterium]
MRSRAAAFLTAGLLALVLSAVAVPASAKPPIWIARRGHAVVTLFGSIHLLPPGLDWRPAGLDEALASANSLWFELPLDRAAARETVRLVQSKSLLPPKDNLSAHLSPGENAQFDRVAAALGLPAAALERLEPWDVDLMLSLTQNARMGARVLSGVEQTLEATTPPSVARRAFETPREQIGFLADAPMKAQIASLAETLNEIETEPHLYDEIVQDWMSGDVAKFEADGLEPMRLKCPIIYDRLVRARNRRWAKRIARMLDHGADAVVVVGMDHLVGPDGVPTLLRAKGFTVEGPLQSPPEAQAPQTGGPPTLSH